MCANTEKEKLRIAVLESKYQESHIKSILNETVDPPMVNRPAALRSVLSEKPDRLKIIVELILTIDDIKRITQKAKLSGLSIDDDPDQN